MSSELLDYIHAVKPSLSDEKRAKIGLLLIHYITLTVSVISWLASRLDRSLVDNYSAGIGWSCQDGEYSDRVW